MKKIFQSDETNNRKIELVRSIWTGSTSIFVDGKQARKINKTQFILEEPGQESLYIYLYGNEFKGMELVIDGKTITVLRKLKVYEYILSVLPLYMVVIGGAIGGALAGAAVVILLSFMRFMDNIFIKLIVSIAVSGLVYYLWYLIASAIAASL